MWFAISFLLAAAVVSATDDTRRQEYHYDEDISAIDQDDRNVIPDINRRWPNNTIPFEIHHSLINDTDLIQEAMDEYQKFTCIRFVRRSNERYYVSIKKTERSYYYVGCIKYGKQLLQIGSKHINKGWFLHQLGHTVGLQHEHIRSDRDEYLTVNWENIEKGMEKEFALLKPDENILITPFDYSSIMIYDNFGYSKDGSPTLSTKTGQELRRAGIKTSLTYSDIVRVRKMYNC